MTGLHVPVVFSVAVLRCKHSFASYLLQLHII